MKSDIRCGNMNHGRVNAPVKFCPTCGETVNRTATGKCDQATHAAHRKSRLTYCHSCGKKLASI